MIMFAGRVSIKIATFKLVIAIPRKFTHFHTYFDNDTALFLSKYLRQELIYKDSNDYFERDVF